MDEIHDVRRRSSSVWAGRTVEALATLIGCSSERVLVRPADLRRGGHHHTQVSFHWLSFERSGRSGDTLGAVEAHGIGKGRVFNRCSNVLYLRIGIPPPSVTENLWKSLRRLRILPVHVARPPALRPLRPFQPRRVSGPFFWKKGPVLRAMRSRRFLDSTAEKGA